MCSYGQHGETFILFLLLRNEMIGEDDNVVTVSQSQDVCVRWGTDHIELGTPAGESHGGCRGGSFSSSSHGVAEGRQGSTQDRLTWRVGTVAA